jgi:hypothetical protein
LTSDSSAAASSDPSNDTVTAASATTAPGDASSGSSSAGGVSAGDQAGSPPALAAQPVTTVAGSSSSAGSSDALAQAPSSAEINASAEQDLQSAALDTGVPSTFSSQPVTPETQLATVASLAVVVAANTPAVDTLAAPTVAADSDGSAATPKSGSTAVDAADAGPGTLTISVSAPTGGQSAIAAGGSPSAVAAAEQTTTGATTPTGTPPGDSGSIPIAPPVTELSVTSAQNVMSSDTGTLGARGPPSPEDPAMMPAVHGRSVRTAADTLAAVNSATGAPIQGLAVAAQPGNGPALRGWST